VRRSLRLVDKIEEIDWNENNIKWFSDDSDDETFEWLWNSNYFEVFLKSSLSELLNFKFIELQNFIQGTLNECTRKKTMQWQTTKLYSGTNEGAYSTLQTPITEPGREIKVAGK